MTGFGVCGIFIPDLVQSSPSGANRKVSSQFGGGWYYSLLGRGVVYKACRVGSLY